MEYQFTYRYPSSPQEKEATFLRLKSWAAAKDYCSYHTDNAIAYPEGGFRHLLAVEAEESFSGGAEIFDQLKKAHQQQPAWLFGYFGYGLKNALHELEEHLPDRLGFSPARFFRPKHLFFLYEDRWEIHTHTEPGALLEEILNTPLAEPQEHAPLNIHSSMSREAYLQKVAAIKEHILEGDCYELNLCMEFWAEGVKEEPLLLFERLNQRSPMPFACFQRFGHQHLLCASPERFLRKKGTELLSQPIKGTMRRGRTEEEDLQLKAALRNSEKEQAENLMIVDLVRNDLAISAQPGSVQVPELFGIYSFRQVHQMISSVRARLREGIHFLDAIRHAFPMGSMTGAPKRKVMELIDRYETVQRGVYSGAAGYISPEGDFDFNVVIRSLLLDSDKGLASFQVGSALTYDAEAAYEYEECLLKAQALREVLQGTPSQASSVLHN